MGAMSLKLEGGARSPRARCSAPLINLCSLQTKTNHKPSEPSDLPLVKHSRGICVQSKTVALEGAASPAAPPPEGGRGSGPAPGGVWEHSPSRGWTVTYSGCQASGPWSAGLWASRDHSRAEQPFISCQRAQAPETDTERGGCGARLRWARVRERRWWLWRLGPGLAGTSVACVHRLLLSGITWRSPSTACSASATICVLRQHNQEPQGL